jgi:hypothetical protein
LILVFIFSTYRLSRSQSGKANKEEAFFGMLGSNAVQEKAIEW